MPRCQYATSMFNVTMPRCNDARRNGATMPLRDVNVQRDDATRRCRLSMFEAYAWPHYGPMHDARRYRLSMHEDDVDWLLHDDTNPRWLVAWQRHKLDVDMTANSGTSGDAAACCCFYTASKPRCAVTWRAITANAQQASALAAAITVIDRTYAHCIHGNNSELKKIVTVIHKFQFPLHLLPLTMNFVISRCSALIWLVAYW